MCPRVVRSIKLLRLFVSALSITKYIMQRDGRSMKNYLYPKLLEFCYDPWKKKKNIWLHNNPDLRFYSSKSCKSSYEISEKILKNFPTAVSIVIFEKWNFPSWSSLRWTSNVQDRTTLFAKIEKIQLENVGNILPATGSTTISNDFLKLTVSPCSIKFHWISNSNFGVEWQNFWISWMFVVRCFWCSKFDKIGEKESFMASFRSSRL